MKSGVMGMTHVKKLRIQSLTALPIFNAMYFLRMYGSQRGHSLFKKKERNTVSKI